MGRSIFDQETQVRATRTGDYDDTLAAGAGLAPGTGSLLDDFNRIRSQVKRILDDSAGNWYDDIPSVTGLGAAKQRDIKDLNTDLDELEEQRIICGVELLQNVTVPANAYATGDMTMDTQANHTDGETFTLSDGYNSYIFELDTGGGFTNIQVDISAAVSAIDVATAVVSAINGSAALITADNTGGTSATVDLTQDRGGTRGNTTITHTIVAGGFSKTDFSGGAGDVVVLSQASSETPSQAAAVGAGTALGALVASLAADVGANDLAEISSTNPTVPKNRILIRDAALREGFTSNDRQVYGLLQAESGVVDGDSFDDTTKQVQISFVRINDVSDDLEPCPGEDVGGKIIEYVYGNRVTLDTLPEDCGFPNFTFTDGSASVSVTLDNAIDNQGVTPATQIQNITVQMASGVSWTFSDNASQPLFAIIEGSGGGTSQVLVDGDVDTFQSDAVDNTFTNGITVDTSNPIAIGETAGVIETTGADDLDIRSGAELVFDDSYRSASSWSIDGIRLADSTAEWTSFESTMEEILGSGNGEVSLLKAITEAAQNRRKDKVYSVYAGPAALAANTDVGGPSSTANNLDTDLPDMSGGTFILDFDVYINGQFLRPHTTTGSHDYSPGTTSGAAGVQELKFHFKLKADDQLAVVPYA